MVYITVNQTKWRAVQSSNQTINWAF